MKKTFSYNKGNDPVVNGLVETFTALTQASLDGKNNTKEYKETNAEFTSQLMKCCVEAIPGMTFSTLDDVKNPMVYNDMFFIHKFNTILAQAITPVVPTVASANYDQLYDVTQVGYGDNAKYQVSSNELFIVNDQAEGIARGGLQTTYDAEYTVTARRKQIAIYVDWYQVAAGVHDWGKMGAKIGASFMAYIQAKAVQAMASVITSAGTHGIAGYIASGFSDANWLTVSRNVELANGGSKVYALGTKIALGSVLPNNTTVPTFVYNENSEIVRTGFLPEYKNIPLIELDNALIPNTFNGTPTVVVPDDMIYFLPMGGYKPLKLVFEGDNVTVMQDPLTSVDHTYGMTVDMRIGIDAVVGSKFGAIDVNP